MSLVDAYADFVGSVPHRLVALPYGEARVWDLGEGRPIVLLHGIAGSRRVFFRVAPLLARHRRVIVPTLRGETFPAPAATWDGFVDDLDALLERLDLREVTLVGFSFGGTVAIAHAARGGDRVREVVLQGTFLRFRLRPRDRAIHALSYLVPAGLGARYFARRSRHGPENRLLAEHAPGLDILMPEWSGKTPFASLRRRVALIGKTDLAPELRRVAAPLTIAHGRRDKVVPAPFFERIRRIRPDVRAVVWEEVGHLAALTHPERFVTLVEEAGAASDPARRDP